MPIDLRILALVLDDLRAPTKVIQTTTVLAYLGILSGPRRARTPQRSRVMLNSTLHTCLVLDIFGVLASVFGSVLCLLIPLHYH
jgi:hypothetical protein